MSLPHSRFFRRSAPQNDLRGCLRRAKNDILCAIVSQKGPGALWVSAEDAGLGGPFVVNERALNKRRQGGNRRQGYGNVTCAVPA